MNTRILPASPLAQWSCTKKRSSYAAEASLLQKESEAIPGGSVELGETLQEAAEREILEEAGIIVKAGNPIHVFDVITKDEVRRAGF